MKLSQIFWLCGLAGCLAVSLIHPTVSLAQKAPRALNRLPPPPPVRDLNKSPKPSSQANLKPKPSQSTPIAASSPPVREYIFKAPSSNSTPLPRNPNPKYRPSRRTAVTPKKTQPVATPRGTTALYRVQVMGTSEFLLTKVKAVEPLAFVRVGEGAIYAGLFQQQKLAQQRVQELKKKGLPAKVVTVQDQGTQKNVPEQRLVRR